MSFSAAGGVGVSTSVLQAEVTGATRM
jgi:hypothetical protein